MNNIRIQKGTYTGEENDYEGVSFITIDNPETENPNSWYEITVIEGHPMYEQFDKLYKKTHISKTR